MTSEPSNQPWDHVALNARDYTPLLKFDFSAINKPTSITSAATKWIEAIQLLHDYNVQQTEDSPAVFSDIDGLYTKLIVFGLKLHTESLKPLNIAKLAEIHLSSSAIESHISRLAAYYYTFYTFKESGL